MSNRERAEALALMAWDHSGVKGDWAKHPAVFQLAKAIEAALDQAWERGAQSIKHQHLWLKSTPVETFCTKCGLKWSEAGTLTENGEGLK